MKFNSAFKGLITHSQKSSSYNIVNDLESKPVVGRAELVRANAIAQK